MAITSKLESIVLRQKEILTELEDETRSILGADLTKENEALKKELEKLKSDYLETREALKRMKDENSGLKNALYEQIYSERVTILNNTSRKLDIYFQGQYNDELNRLTELENRVKNRIKTMMHQAREHRITSEDEIYAHLHSLETVLDQRITAAKAQLAMSEGAFSQGERSEFENLKEEQITEGMVKGIAKKNNLEALVGLNIINKLGIFLIIIGVIAASQFTYLKLPPQLQGLCMFLLGGVMLGAGEFLNRKKANIFSLGVTGGGVAVLYVALAVSYFGLEILQMYAAIGLCVLITAGAFALSARYNSQTIATFALVGGYMPIFAIANNHMLTYSAMVYFVVLNLFALSVSFRKKWMVSTYIGFFLNVAATIYITYRMIVDVSSQPFGMAHAITLLYILFAFIIYTLIPVFGSYYQKLRLKAADVFLIGLNTFISAIIMYIAFDAFKLEDYNGVLAIAFACLYLLLGRFIETKFQGEKHTQALFYLTGFAFVVLIIPFQFGKVWWSLGWLSEGVALAAYGIIKEERNIKRGGLAVCGLCLLAFLMVDVLSFGDLFAYKYMAITLGSLVILGSYIYKKELSGTFAVVYKYFVIVNLWFYSMYLICFKLQELLDKIMVDAFVDIVYLTTALFIVVTFLIAYGVPRIRILSDMGTKVISMVLYAIGILWLFGLNTAGAPINHLNEPTTGVWILGTAILLLVGLLSVFAMADLVRCLVLERKLGAEWYPLLISAYFVIVLTQNLITQYNLDFTNASISIIYMLAALSWIIYGFIRRYAFIRWFGLGLSILAVGKLFLIDLTVLREGVKVISYFAFGVTLLAISFVYQYFNKRLELKGEVVTDAKKDSE